MFWFFTSQSRNMVQNSRKGPQRRNEISGVLKGMCRRVNIGNRYVPILTQPFVTLLDKFFHQNVKKFPVIVVVVYRIIVNSRTFSSCYFIYTQSPQDEIFNTLIINDKGKQSGAL